MTGTVLTEKHDLLASLSSQEVTCSHTPKPSTSQVPDKVGHVPPGVAFTLRARAPCRPSVQHVKKQMWDAEGAICHRGTGRQRIFKAVGKCCVGLEAVLLTRGLRYVATTHRYSQWRYRNSQRESRNQVTLAVRQMLWNSNFHECFAYYPLGTWLYLGTKWCCHKKKTRKALRPSASSIRSRVLWLKPVV